MIASGRRAGGGVSTRRGWQGYARAQQLVFTFNPRRHRQSSRAAACTYTFISTGIYFYRQLEKSLMGCYVTRHPPKVFLAGLCNRATYLRHIII